MIDEIKNTGYRMTSSVKGLIDMEPEAPTSSTLSTRFTPQQREVVEKAAEILGCTAAKHIRDSVVLRSVDVVNAQGEAGPLLRRLADLVLVQLQNPRIREVWRRGPEDSAEVTYIEFQREDELDELESRELEIQRGALNHDKYELIRTEYLVPGEEDRVDIKKALHDMGTEFIGILLENWDKPRRRDVGLESVMSKERLLRDSID